jgi:ketosteroid isomerase-like protein
VSRENVETLRKLQDAVRGGDWDTVAAAIDPDIFVRADPSWPEQRFYGRDAYLAFTRGVVETWGPDADIEGVVDLGDRVLMHSQWKARGRLSGVEGELRWSSISTFRDGRIVFVEFFSDRDQALKAVGLEE